MLPYIKTQRALVDAEEDERAMTELAARNQATAARQNAAALMPRQNPRAGGGRYTRRGMWTPGGSGLDRANAMALTEARKRTRYAQIDQGMMDNLTSRKRGGGPMQAITLYH